MTNEFIVEVSNALGIVSYCLSAGKRDNPPPIRIENWSNSKF